jgi:hypothetical protein
VLSFAVFFNISLIIYKQKSKEMNVKIYVYYRIHIFPLFISLHGATDLPITDLNVSSIAKMAGKLDFLDGRGYFVGLRVTKRNKATVLLTLTLFQTPTLTLILTPTLT